MNLHIADCGITYLQQWISMCSTREGQGMQNWGGGGTFLKHFEEDFCAFISGKTN
jgi:hypothetical protein